MIWEHGILVMALTWRMLCLMTYVMLMCVKPRIFLLWISCYFHLWIRWRKRKHWNNWGELWCPMQDQCLNLIILFYLRSMYSKFASFSSYFFSIPISLHILKLLRITGLPNKWRNQDHQSYRLLKEKKGGQWPAPTRQLLVLPTKWGDIVQWSIQKSES